MKCKWAVKGRDALGKDLGDVESATCLHKGEATPQAQHLLPIFLELRRTFLLPPSPLPLAIVAPYYDILPASPDPDEEYREPSISNTTASLYVNPRLENEAAARILEELVEAEREKAVAEGANEEEVAELLDELVKHVEKRVSGVLTPADLVSRWLLRRGVCSCSKRSNGRPRLARIATAQTELSSHTSIILWIERTASTWIAHAIHQPARRGQTDVTCNHHGSAFFGVSRTRSSGTQ